MTRPTPGPWKQNVLLVEDAAGVLIAHCWQGETPMPEVAEANARLIARTPELVAALRELHNAVVLEGLIDGQERPDAWGDAFIALLAALKGARGLLIELGEDGPELPKP